MFNVNRGSHWPGVLVGLVSFVWISGVFASCPSTPGLTQLHSTAWGIDNHNTRFQPDTTITSTNAGKLKLKWVYGLHTDTPRSYPLVTEDTIFYGDSGFGLVALDRETGCIRWHAPFEEAIASAIVPANVDGRMMLFFTLMGEGLMAVDAKTGESLWRKTVDDEPVPHLDHIC